jgi:hypothetical protein
VRGRPRDDTEPGQGRGRLRKGSAERVVISCLELSLSCGALFEAVVSERRRRGRRRIRPPIEQGQGRLLERPAERVLVGRLAGRAGLEIRLDLSRLPIRQGAALWKMNCWRLSGRALD